MIIAIGSDHGGFNLKEHLKKILQNKNRKVEDVGCFSKDSVDYPDYAIKVAQKVSEGTANRGIVVCTTGIGMCITANKFPQVRAALCFTPEMGKSSRVHNNANVLALGEKVVSFEVAEKILEAWLENEFETGSRHERRVNKVDACLF